MLHPTFISMGQVRPATTAPATLHAVPATAGHVHLLKELLVCNAGNASGAFSLYRVAADASGADDLVANLMLPSIAVPRNDTKTFKLNTVLAPGERLVVASETVGVALTYTASGLDVAASEAGGTTAAIAGMGWARPAINAIHPLHTAATGGRLEELLVCNANPIEAAFDLFKVPTAGLATPDAAQYQLVGGLMLSPYNTAVMGFGLVLDPGDVLYARAVTPAAPINFMGSGVTF